MVILVRGDREVARVAVPLPADLFVVDALARLQLLAQRHGCALEVRGASIDLRELLGLTGLDGVVPCTGEAPAGLGRQVVRQPEGGEQAGVEEVVVPDDPVA